MTHNECITATALSRFRSFRKSSGTGMQLLRRYRERKLVSNTDATKKSERKFETKNCDHHGQMATSLPLTPLPRNPASPHMSNESMRVASFRFNGIWDYSKLAATPEQLAKAGFYYMGHSDKVQCYYCNGALESWDYNDDPWIEHAKWFPCCEFMVCKKGTAFVTGVVSQFPDLIRPDPEKIRNAPPEAFLTTRNTNILSIMQSTSRDGIIDPQRRQRQLDLFIKNIMDTSPHVKQALELGIEDIKIKAALKMHCQTNERDFVSLNELLDTLDSIEENIPPSYDDISKTPTLPSSSSERECKICFDNEADIVFLPCGHLTTCGDCATKIRLCPICRSQVHQKIKTYTS